MDLVQIIIDRYLYPSYGHIGIWSCWYMVMLAYAEVSMCKIRKRKEEKVGIDNMYIEQVNTKRYKNK